jgi:3-oxoacyl-[acyl-carrier protein] reductase
MIEIGVTMRIKGKVAIITGAGSGFGEGIATRFAAEGAKVVVADINGTAANRVAAEIGDAAVAIKTDVTKMSDVEAMIALAETQFGRLDILINNAGYTSRNGPMMDVDEKTYDRMFDVNTKAIYLAARTGVPVLKKYGGGTIINVASIGALRPRPGLVWYNGSKGAALNMTKGMAVELAPDNIRVNALCPVLAETGLLEEFMGVKDTPENRNAFLKTIPLGRLGRPSDVAGAALYLCSDDAEFITGVSLEVDGGRGV